VTNALEEAGAGLIGTCDNCGKSYWKTLISDKPQCCPVTAGGTKPPLTDSSQPVGS